MEFSYVILDKNGQRQIGQLEAESSKAAADSLRGQGFLPISVRTGAIEAQKFDVKNVFGRVSLQDKIGFIQNFAVMLKSGFPISKAMSVLTEQTENATLKKVLQDITHGIESGESLSDSMSKHPKVFSNIFINLVKVGEASGNLDQSLQNLANQLKKDHDLIRKTKGAMIYPAVVLSAMVIIGILMFTFVLPKLTALFEDFNVKLPLMTRIIIGAVNFMKAYGIYVLGLFIFSIFSLVFASRKPAGSAIIDKYILKLPVLGKLVKQTNLARFSRTLASLLKAGMPILESVRITGESLSNAQYKQALFKAEAMVRAGSPLSAAMKNYPMLFPPLILSMVSVGEESGTVDSTLEEIATFYEGEVDQAVSNMSAILEPVLMLIVGAGVGVIAVGLIMPIYNLTQAV